MTPPPANLPATRWLLPFFLCCLVLFTSACIAIQAWTAAWAGDLSRTGDEAAHFVNAAMIHDYLARAAGSNPMRFARDYYLHLPRVSIGHWPPFYYLVLGGVFLITGTSIAVAVCGQAVIAGAVAALVASIVAARAGGGGLGKAIAGLAAGVAVLAYPELLRLVSVVMVDTFLAALVLCCLCWARFARGGGTLWAVAFALCAAAAILSKGNGLGLGLLPPLYVALSGQTRLIANGRTWLAAAIVLVLTAPWYALTYKLAAGGFVYGWGTAYTSVAVPAYALAALRSFGAIGLLAFALGSVVAARRAWRGAPDETVLACAAGTIGLFLFQLIAPADIQPRYLVAAVPAAVVVAAYGFAALAARLAWPAAAVVTCGLLANAALTFQAPHAQGSAMNATARDILATQDPAPLVLVAAGPNGEGALIAAFAANDPGHAHYVIRASQAMAVTNFMGSNYQPRFQDEAAVQRWIADSHIAWLVLDVGADSLAMQHDRQVASLAGAPPAGWSLAGTHNSVRLFRLSGPPATAADIASVLRQVVPATVSGGFP